MPYIKECINSVLCQNYVNFNVIILENMSDDGTSEYLDSLVSEKITIFKSKKFLSIEENWARIQYLTMSEYMTIVMADDTLQEDYLSSIVDIINKYPNKNIYRTNINLIDTQSKLLSSSSIKEKITIYDYLKGRLKHTYTKTFCGYCIKTSAYKKINGIDCKYRLMHTDDKLVMELIGNDYMVVSPTFSANYRCHSKSESGSPNKQAALEGFNYFFEWIYGLNNQKMIRIVRDYLPYHLNKIAPFLNSKEMEQHKQIYKMYNINEQNFKYKLIQFFNDYLYIKNEITRIKCRFLFITFSIKKFWR